MSDFLATIAARTVETDIGIQPRRPARFEPDAPGFAPALVEEWEERFQPAPERPRATGETGYPRYAAPQPEQSPTRAADLARETRPASPHPSDELGSDVPRPAGPSSWNGTAPLTTPLSVQPAGPPSTLVSPAAHTEPVHTPAQGRPPSDSSVEPEALHARHNQERRVVDLEERVMAVHSPAPDPPARAADSPHHAGREGFLPARPPKTFHRDAATPMIGQLQPYLPPQNPGEIARAPVELTAPPTINVTINRVEIRAPAAPLREPRRSRDSPSVLPLNEYLRRHRGGA